MPNSPAYSDIRDHCLAHALGLCPDQIRQIPEYIREFAYTLLTDNGLEGAR